MLPPGFPTTTVMAYGSQVKIPGSTATEFVRVVPGSVFENVRGIPTRVKWRNEIEGDHFLPIDPTLHWANPNAFEPPERPFVLFPPGYPKALNPVPHVTHNHGLVVVPDFDGTAEQWFTRSTAFTTGPSFVNRDYDKPNEQPGTQLFYHEHAMGMTRLGAYAGLLGAAYFIRDPRTALDGPNSPLPRAPFEIPLVLSDRSFFTDGELNFPRVSSNPGNAYWTPGDGANVIIANGKTWPNLNVQRRQYRFRTLGAANLRTFTIQLDNNGVIVPFTIIGSDGGYLPRPQVVNEVTLGITERADLLIDFSKFAPGTRIIMRNTNLIAGEDPNLVGTVMRFTVTDSPVVAPPVLDPALFPRKPFLATDAPTRVKTFHNIIDSEGSQLRSNDGLNFTSPTTEFPLVGSTENWDLINIAGGGDHQIHLHLIEFQVVSRRAFDSAAYELEWQLLNGQHVVSRPIVLDPTPFFTGPLLPALPYETGWKDTVRAPPGFVTRIVARWAPQEVPAGGVRPGENKFPIDPIRFPGYLWHCHILSHEDNDMMRKLPLVRIWAAGVNYTAETVIAHQNINYRARVPHTSRTGETPNTRPSLWERVNNNDGSWQTQIIYAVGDRVLFQGRLFEAIQLHQAQPDWTPPATPTLWRPLPMDACGQLADLCNHASDPASATCNDVGRAGNQTECRAQFRGCLGACTGPHSGQGQHGPHATPCSGRCNNATSFSVPDGTTFSSGALGANATCHETDSELLTGSCTSGRRLTINGVPQACDGSNWRLPTQRNHGYCIQTTTGTSSASFTVR